MKILYATLGYKPAFRLGGPIHSISAAAERLVRKGHKVIVFTTNSNSDEDLDVPTNQPVDVDGVEVWYFKRKEPIKRWLPFIPYLSKSIGYLYAPEMKAELDRIVPSVDIVHIQSPFVYPTYVAGKAAIRHRIPLLYQQRGALGFEHLKFRSLKKHIYISLVERPIMRRAATLIALTQAELDSYRKLGVATVCRVIPNGVDIVESSQSLIPVANSYFKIAPNDMVILFMARLHPTKGVDRLLRAFINISSKFLDAKLVIAGPDEWGNVDKYKRVIRQAGIENRVLFPGMLLGEVKQMLLSRADLFCLPSDAEGFSMGVLEAMANSTAVLLSPECHFTEVDKIGAGRTVLSDSDSLSNALMDLLNKPEKLKAMGIKGRDFVASKYSWDSITDQLLDVYIDAIERNRSNIE